MKTMLKNTLILFAFGLLTLSSCTKSTEEVVDNQVTTQPNDYITNRLNELANSSQEIEVEYATQEEINQAMIENGLNPFTERQINEATEPSLRGIFHCSVWHRLGDFNRDGRLNYTDLVDAHQYLCDNADSCNGSISTSLYNYENITASASDFSWLSGLRNGNEWYVLNYNDLDAAHRFIIGNITCK